MRRKLLRAKEVAERLNMARRTFYANHRKMGLIPIDLFTGKRKSLCESCAAEIEEPAGMQDRFRWFEDEVEEFIRQREQARFKQTASINAMRRRASGG